MAVNWRKNFEKASFALVFPPITIFIWISNYIIYVLINKQCQELLFLPLILLITYSLLLLDILFFVIIFFNRGIVERMVFGINSISCKMMFINLLLLILHILYYIIWLSDLFQYKGHGNGCTQSNKPCITNLLNDMSFRTQKNSSQGLK